MIPYGKHVIDSSDIDAVVDLLQHHFLTQGPKVIEFEEALCTYSGARHCQSVNSGTSALHIACLAAGLEPGDTLWTSPNSFVASANCGLYCGASVDFVDICSETRNICVTALQHKLELAELNNSLPKVLVVVHFSGLSCEMRAIKSLCDKYYVTLIEDASHALGATYLDAKVGSCSYSDMTVFSFHPVKSITTAEGGAVMTNDPELAKSLALFAKHGITRDENQLLNSSVGAWHYEQQVLGYNYRLSDLHACLGITQLAKLDKFVAKRSHLAKRYSELLADLPLKLPTETSESNSAWHIYVVELMNHNRKKVFERLRKQGVGVNVHYIPIHTQPYYQQLGFKSGDFPVAERYYAKALTLPLYPSLSEQEQDKVVKVLSDALC